MMWSRSRLTLGKYENLTSLPSVFSAFVVAWAFRRIDLSLITYAGLYLYLGLFYSNPFLSKEYCIKFSQLEVGYLL